MRKFNYWVEKYRYPLIAEVEARVLQFENLTILIVEIS
jgi:hypothetical protein